MPRDSGRRLLLAVLGLAGAAAALLPAQERTQLEPFRTEVNYIRLDIYPTADGKPITDLQQSDVEVLDGSVPQTIDRFERVVVRGARSQEVRREPVTVAEMREATQDIRARLFVVFLDTEHVEGSGALNIKSPLISALNQLIGGDDLIAVMTPDMQARDLTFTRRTSSIEALLMSRWGQRDRNVHLSPDEQEIAQCYPGISTDPGKPAKDAGIAQEMILRRREERTLDALERLVQHLRFVREERKAVITISNGWRLFGENAFLRRPVEHPGPITPPIGVDPRSGRLGTGLPVQPLEARPKCEQDRISLSNLQHEQRFRDILHQANAANTSFYPIDPRGLVVFDEDIVPVAGVGVGMNANPSVNIVEDRTRLNARSTALRTMAEVTDGLAIVNTGEISAGLRRMVDDLSSYYLIGYYSTEKMDGKFHRLTVRVKRPGVTVRARTGYLAATAADAAAAARAAAGAVAPKPGAAEAKAVELPLSALGIYSRERPLRLQATSGWTPGGTATLWVVAEVPAATARHDWSDGGQADAMLIDNTGATIATERLTIAPGTRSLRFALGSRATLTPGEYQVQLRAKGTTAPLAATESTRVMLPAAPASAGALFVRRGITTGNQPQPTADSRFRRTDRIVVEFPTPTAETGSARLLDRVGKVLAIPVTAAIRDDADGTRWRTLQLVLAPLAPGDYVIESTAGSEKTLTAFRVLP